MNEILEAGIITPKRSAWSFSVVIGTQKDGKPPCCVDYRQLNRLMRPDRLPLPKIEEPFDELSGAKFPKTLDLNTVYW